MAAKTNFRTNHRTIKIDGLNIFYREAGDASAPALVLLHGFPASSHHCDLRRRKTKIRAQRVAQ